MLDVDDIIEFIKQEFDNESENDKTQALMNYFINEIDYFVKEIAVIKTKKVVFIAQKTIELKIRFKIKFNKTFKSFKFEKFTINFNSNLISIESEFDIVIQSNVFLVANSNSISVSKNSKLIFSRLNSFKSTSIKSIFESIIKSNVVLVASSISISICISILNIEKFEAEKVFIVD